MRRVDRPVTRCPIPVTGDQHGGRLAISGHSIIDFLHATPLEPLKISGKTKTSVLEAVCFRFDSKRALASRMHLIQVDLGAFINYALGFKKTKNKIKFDFFLPFYFIFEFGFNQTTRVSQIHLELKILIFETKKRPRLPQGQHIDWILQGM